MTDRKELRRAYKESPPPMGVWSVRNTVEGRALIGTAPNVAGRINRERFTLEMGSHPSRQLQADWNRLGAGSFAFDVIDTLEQPAEPEADPAEDLEALRIMWIERLGIPAEKLYPDRG
jgi:hypothetical protein